MNDPTKGHIAIYHLNICSFVKIIPLYDMTIPRKMIQRSN